MTIDGEQRQAILSHDGRFRYRLTRRWARGRTACFIMLNPSTADAVVDDPTIRRCKAFARRWGYAAVEVVNLFALRSVTPSALLTAHDPVGPDNDQHVQAAIDDSALVIAAWGAHVSARGRERALLATVHVPVLHSLGLTLRGAPRHPLYVRGSTRPRRYVLSA